MNKKHVLPYIVILWFLLLPFSFTKAESNWEHIIIEKDHTFTITFNANVEQHKGLLQSVNIFSGGQTIAYTPNINGTMMTLDPTTDLLPSKTYTVEVALTNGETYTRDFSTKAPLAPAIEAFVKQYPTYKDATVITKLQEKFDEFAYVTSLNEQPSTALQQAVSDIPANIEAFKKSIAEFESLYNEATKYAAAATSNETDVAMQLELFNELGRMHLLDAPSLTALIKTQQARDNAVTLLKATEAATEAGLELVSMLEELNNAISDILLVAPASTQKMRYVDDLQSAFTKGVSQVNASDSTIAKQISSIESILESTTDYMYVVDEAQYFIADIESYQQQFATWKDAKDVKNVVSAYNKLQTAIQTINNKISSTSNISSIEATLSTQMDIVDELAMDIPTYIDTYLEEQLQSVNDALEAVEEAATKKDIYYFSTDSYQNAYATILTLESTYSFYDEAITYSEFKEAIADAHAKVKALKKELGV